MYHRSMSLICHNLPDNLFQGEIGMHWLIGWHRNWLRFAMLTSSTYWQIRWLSQIAVADVCLLWHIHELLACGIPTNQFVRTCKYWKYYWNAYLIASEMNSAQDFLSWFCFLRHHYFKHQYPRRNSAALEKIFFILIAVSNDFVACGLPYFFFFKFFYSLKSKQQQHLESIISHRSGGKILPPTESQLCSHFLSSELVHWGCLKLRAFLQHLNKGD